MSPRSHGNQLEIDRHDARTYSRGRKGDNAPIRARTSYSNVVWHDIRLHNCPQTRYTPPRLSLNNSAGVVGRDRVQINLTHNISDSFPPASPISRTTSSNDLKFWEQVEKTTEIRMVPKSWRKSAFEFFENGLIYPTCPGAPRSLRSREPLVSRVDWK